MDFGNWPWLLPLLGVAAGAVMGYAARRQHFCTMRALERRWYAGDSSGLRTWALAAGVALALTQTLQFAGVIDTGASFYLSANFAWTGAIIGGLSFGVGMALIGTCGFGALVRLGGGSLRSFVVLIVIGLSAMAAQRGLLAPARLKIVDDLALDLSAAGDQSIGSLLSAYFGTDLRFGTAIAVSALVLVWVFKDGRFRSDLGRIAAGSAIGSVVPFGWIATTLARASSFEPVQIEAGSFVVPVADTILQVITLTGVMPDYGVGLVIGVVLGAAVCAVQRRDVRWEACDSAGELGRHLLGGLLMGVGGVFALGCTIGQGVTAFSALALSAPIVIVSIAMGARLGLAYLVEGSPAAILYALRPARAAEPIGQTGSKR